MAKDAGVTELEEKLDAVLAVLMHEARGSRTTLRIDDAARGWSVTYPCAEAVQPGVKPLKHEGSINQRGAATAQWMEKNRRYLIQPDLINSPDPAPPAALMSVYAAKAQLLVPLVNKADEMQGWISVHYIDSTQTFTDSDIAALAKAEAEVKRLTGIGA